jgi:drug/metabolite transporter (DMT)-like permease
MSPSDLSKLIFLAAIWGGSFIFMRISVPEVGVILTATLRISLAGFSLLLFTYLHRVPMMWRLNVKFYAVVGFFSAALPFSCFSFAAQYLPSAYSAVLNSTAPLFGALFSILWLSDRLTLRKLSGLLLGITGVTVLVGAGTILLNLQTLLAAFACLVAAASYAISSILVKKLGDHQHADLEGPARTGIHPYAMASGSLAMGGLMLLPALPFSLPAVMPSNIALASLLALSLLSSALAQIIFIPLIGRVGPTRAMSVTFLIPIFGMLWGYLFLHEPVRMSTVIGSAIVLTAMRLILTSATLPVASAKSEKK